MVSLIRMRHANRCCHVLAAAACAELRPLPSSPPCLIQQGMYADRAQQLLQ